MTIMIFDQIGKAPLSLRRSLALGAAAGLLALAGCGAPSGPAGQSPDYYSEAPPPPPPLMGEAPAYEQDGLMGGPPPAPGDVYAQGGLPPAAERTDGVVRFRRGDGVLVTTMRPVPNPEDLSPEDRRRIYGERQARTAAPAYRASGQLTPAPQTSQPAVVARAPSAPAVSAPSRATPAPVAKAPTVKAPNLKAPPVKAPVPQAAPDPTMDPPVIESGEMAENGEKKGGFFSFLERFKFWDREVTPPETADVVAGAEQAADEAGEAVESAATEAVDAAEESNISGTTVLMALAVLAAVLILAAISRNAAARRKEAQRRRRFRTFGYGDTSESDDNQSSGLAAPLAAAAAGAAAATAFAHRSDNEEKTDGDDHHETADTRENEPA